METKTEHSGGDNHNSKCCSTSEACGSKQELVNKFALYSGDNLACSKWQRPQLMQLSFTYLHPYITYNIRQNYHIEYAAWISASDNHCVSHANIEVKVLCGGKKNRCPSP